MSVFYILIPLLPLLASIVIALTGHRLGEASRKVGTVAIGLSFGLSLLAFLKMAVSKQPVSISLYQLLRSGNLTIEFGLSIDQLSVLLLLLVTGVSFVVHAYSSRYMIGDARFSRFFALMALFTFAMVTLVISSNLLMIFMCWELMGICSYLLISHQSDRSAACHAATKAFLVNAVADVGLLFGIILIFATLGTLDVQLILAQASTLNGQTINLLGWVGLDCQVQTVTVILLCIFTGCLGKSAQMPFHVWLPQAMEAPTPVSALIHAATMVNAGPFLLLRFSPLLVMSPVAMNVIAVVGGTTAIFAAVVSLTQTDIKKILAYSTISQIGFMIMTCGVGAFAAAVFHLLAHGILKGYLFLSTGNQLDSASSHGHGATSAQHGRPPWSLYAGALALACAAPLVLFSGPYGQLWTAHHLPMAHTTFGVVGLLTVFFMAVYCVRGVTSLFHFSSSQSVRPRFFSAFHLSTIAVGSVVLVGLLLVLWKWFVPFLLPALAQPQVVTADAWRPFGQMSLFALSLVAAFIGWAIACVLPTGFDPFLLVPAGVRQRLYVLFQNKCYFDEIYDVCLVQPTIRTAKWVWRRIDGGVIDRIVVQSGRATVGLAVWVWRTVDIRGVQQPAGRAGTQSAALPQWLWSFVGTGQVADASGQASTLKVDQAPVDAERGVQNFSPRPIQHQLLIQILWLVGAITFFYWLVL